MFPNFTRIIQELALLLPGFLLGITCHEAAHGYVAYKLGDPTPKFLGRLTLNPLKHLDPVGTLVLVLTRMIGWAKPVPINARYFKHPARDMALCSLAGPVANMLLAVLLTVVLALIPPRAAGFGLGSFSIMGPLIGILQSGIVINIVLACFNLLPIPPLDGSHIVAWLLPPKLAYSYESFGRYGFILVIVLAVTGALSYILNPMLNFVLSVLNSLIRLIAL